jgi:biotin transporter BioY
MKKYDYMGLGLLAAPWTILGGAAGLGGLSALAGTTAGNIIGNVAGSLAIGNTLEGAQRRIFGRSLGDYVSGTL